MISKFIQVSAVSCALALAGIAGANNNNGTQGQSTQQQQQPMQGQQMQGQTQQQQQQGQQGQMPQQNVKSVRLSALDQNQIKEVQTKLKDCGFYQGAVDGVIGNGTRGALSSFFQNQVTLAQQGRISDEALGGFGFSSNDIERVRGVDTSNTNNNNATNNNNSSGVNNGRQNTNGQQ